MVEIVQLKENVVIKGPFWPEDIKIIACKQIGSRIELKAQGIKEKSRFYSSIIKIGELSKIEIISGMDGPSLSANPKEFRLALEALRINRSYEFDPLFAVGVSKVDPLPHQIEAVYDYLLKRPRIRFLLADDPGAGKTIMAGLLIKELKYRKVADKILIVVPPSLISNWQSEMQEKFGELFINVQRESFYSSQGRNIWEKDNQLITSLDFLARSEGVLESLKESDVHWDLIIVDEAHKLSAYRGSKDEIKRTGRYKVGEILSDKSNHLLFLTATPHSGDSEKFRLLLDLLEKNRYSNTELVKEAVRKDENPILLRRLKEQMIDHEGKPLFLPRNVKTIGYNLSTKEELLYNAVTEYVNEHFDKAEKSKQKNTIGFALIVLQRRLASSLRAIKQSLKRRKDKLQYRLDNWDYYKVEYINPDLSEEDLDEFEDLTEEEMRKREEEILSVTTSMTKEELQFEINQIQKLINLAEEIPESSETKLSELKKVLFDVEDIRNKDEKLLVFTEHKDTADYLVERIEQWGFSVCQIDGSMEPGDITNPKKGTRVWAMKEFNEGDVKVLVATEAAGEGINLHKKCSLMINYDVPWNPNRLEQRMGRIHRYGQKKEVNIYNLVAKNTLEGRVLEIILKKLNEMRYNLGQDKVYDVISKFIESEVGQRLDDIIKNVVRERIDPEVFKQKMRRPITNVDIEKLRSSSEQSLAKDYGPMRLLQRYEEYIQITEENRLMPEFIEQFFIEAISYLGCNVKKIDKYYWKIDEISLEVKNALKKYGNQSIKRSYSKIAFNLKTANKHECEFIAPGTQFFDCVSKIIIDKFGPTLQQGSIFTDPSADSPYLLWFIIVSINDGKGRRIGERLFTISYKKDKFYKKGPFITWDLKSPTTKILNDLTHMKEKETEMLNWAFDNLVDPFLEEKRIELTRDLEIRKKYAKLSYDYMISESLEKLSKYQQKINLGKKIIPGTIIPEQRKYEELISKKKEILEEIEREKEISTSVPNIISVVGVLPEYFNDDEIQSTMVRDDDIEFIAMNEVLRYEREAGRIPYDVHSEDLGYDIKSKDLNDIRYIEVKGRAKVGDISLTNNEKIKAERFADKYWLYVVWNCSTFAQIERIRDPHNSLKMKEVSSIRFIIDKDEIKKNAER